MLPVCDNCALNEVVLQYGVVFVVRRLKNNILNLDSALIGDSSDCKVESHPLVACFRIKNYTFALANQTSRSAGQKEVRTLLNTVAN